MIYKFEVGQIVSFGTSPNKWKVYSRHFPDYAPEPYYYLDSQTSPSYQQWALESDLKEVNNV